MYWQDYATNIRIELWPNNWFLRHDNTPKHSIRSCLATKQNGKLDGPNYSPDLVFCVFWLFSKIKIAIEEHWFVTFLIFRSMWKEYGRTLPKTNSKNILNSGSIVQKLDSQSRAKFKMDTSYLFVSTGWFQNM